ncbi:MAG: SoxR reducing system RseC family protein [Candidatus Cryosericum sp.]
MQTDRGLVISRHGDVVMVRLQPHAGCASCSLTQFCVGSKESGSTVKAIALPGIDQGDLVEVSVDDSVILKATAIIYGVPLVAFLAGVLGGYGFSSLAGLTGNPSMALPVVAGFVTLIPGIILSRRVATRLNPTVTVVSKLDQEVARCR